MYPYFDADGISVERLLAEWKWLLREDYGLVAINAFGDLFLKSAQGIFHRLDVSGGKIEQIADSETEFQTLAAEPGKRNEWFLIDEEKKAAQKGFVPNKGQCVGSKIPWVFKESATVRDNLVIADLYDYVSCMGDVFGQMQDVPDGGKVRLRVGPRPK